MLATKGETHVVLAEHVIYELDHQKHMVVVVQDHNIITSLKKLEARSVDARSSPT